MENHADQGVFHNYASTTSTWNNTFRNSFAGRLTH